MRKKNLIISVLLITILILTGCGSKSASRSISISTSKYSAEQLKTFQKDPVKLITAYYNVAVPVFNNCSKSKIKNEYSMVKQIVANFDKSESTYETQLESGVQTIINSNGKFLEFKIGEPTTNDDGTITITVRESWEKKDITSAYTLIKNDDLYYIAEIANN